jgi:sorbitol-specific phosphotransferase system component IIC
MKASKGPHALHLVALLAAVAIPASAFAYVGPGAGLTMLGALLGVLAAIVLAITGVLLWPIRAMLARRRQARKAEQRASSN